MTFDERRAAALKNWLAALTETMSRAGIDRSRWALYPMDEYSGRRRSFMVATLTLLKSIDPSVQIYVNTIDTRGNPTHIADLQAIDAWVDIWQPELSFAEGNGRRFFAALNRPWWIYSNGESPAKARLPFDYRIMAWRAHRLGATGIGFWSYSDTYGSSAWEDLDGTRPDWAVVYEGTPIVSSRRWEAFREGVEDLRMLVAAREQGVETSDVVSGVTSATSSADLDFKRRALLELAAEAK